LRMVLSRPITSSEADSTTSVHQRRGSGGDEVDEGENETVPFRIMNGRYRT
jgi:hypothetical protein